MNAAPSSGHYSGVDAPDAVGNSISVTRSPRILDEGSQHSDTPPPSSALNCANRYQARAEEIFFCRGMRLAFGCRHTP
jgi:hypothetical protein